MRSARIFLAILAPMMLRVSTSLRGISAPIENREDNIRPPVSALIVEPRCHETLPLVIANMRTNLPEVPIQLFYSERNKDFVHELVPPLASSTWSSLSHHSNALLIQSSASTWGQTAGGWPAVTLVPLPDPYFTRMNWTTYSLLLESPEFWDLVSGEKALMFEPDTWVCRNAATKLQQWLKYDYVGAPFNHYVKGCPGGVGNGGFSLRSRQMMRQLAAAAGYDAKKNLPVMSEDIFFCRELQRTKEKKERGSSFSWRIPDYEVHNAQKGDVLESPKFSLVGTTGKFRLRYWPKGHENSSYQYCSAFMIADEAGGVAQVKVSINDEERLLGENGPIEWKAGDAYGHIDFSKILENSVVLNVVLMDQSLGARLPTREVADTFAEEERIDIKKGDPLGVHRPWRYEAWWWELQGNCPGLNILGRAWNKFPLGPKASCRASKSLAKEYLHQYQHFVSTLQLSAASHGGSLSLIHFLWIVSLFYLRFRLE